MADTYIFPKDYQREFGVSVPAVRFAAHKVKEASSIGDVQTEPTGESVWLPMPIAGHETQYDQGWSEATAGIAQVLSSKGGVDKIKNALTAAGLPTEASDSSDEGNAGTISVDGVIGAFLADKVGTGGITSTLLDQAFIQYSGPGYRSHGFSFNLKPKSADESDEIENIIKFFKLNSAPIQENVAEIARLYKVPNVFEITFVPDNGLHKIKVSALDSVKVRYGGEKYNIFSSTKKPVQVDIELSFKELDLLNKEDIEGGY